MNQVQSAAGCLEDLGAGGKGGKIVVVGTPETVAEHLTSHTGRYAKQALKKQEVMHRCTSTLMRQ